MDETIIVTYSPKYKDYQQKIRSKQLDRAQKMVDGKIKKRKGKSQNDPARFVKETKYTYEGEIAEKSMKIAGEICVYTNDHITVEEV